VGEEDDDGAIRADPSSQNNAVYLQHTGGDNGALVVIYLRCHATHGAHDAVCRALVVDGGGL